MDKQKVSNINSVKDTSNGKTKMIFNIDLDRLPEDVSISTMTITCKIDTQFNVTNIGKYIDLKHNGIIAVKHGNSDDKTTNRSLIFKRQLSQKNKKKKKAFYNQATIIVKSKKDKKINIKLFSNGAIQMTGCKSIEGVIDGLTRVFDEMKTIKATLDYKLNKIVERPFVSTPNSLEVQNLYDVKICMINSNFCIGFNIDRDALFELLINDKIECSYDPIIHACVNIKFEHPEKTISVFVFESGAVIITGARTCSQIVEAYNFINKYLLKNYNCINKNNTLTNSTILEFLNSEQEALAEAMRAESISDDSTNSLNNKSYSHKINHKPNNKTMNKLKPSKDVLDALNATYEDNIIGSGVSSEEITVEI
jgi:TATA-box binding protein (TBP) (component of TFIID and TFIIIB)